MDFENSSLNFDAASRDTIENRKKEKNKIDKTTKFEVDAEFAEKIDPEANDQDMPSEIEEESIAVNSAFKLIEQATNKQNEKVKNIILPQLKELVDYGETMADMGVTKKTVESSQVLKMQCQELIDNYTQLDKERHNGKIKALQYIINLTDKLMPLEGNTKTEDEAVKLENLYKTGKILYDKIDSVLK